jgi:hypothetical protein
MASIRKLKHQINRISFHLINECFNYRYFHTDQAVKTEEVIRDLIRMRNELIRRTNHSEPESGTKELRRYYHTIREDLGRLTELTRSAGIQD